MATYLLALGCLLWVPLAWIAARHLRAFRQLASVRPPAPARWPRVSVVIAARDEAAAVRDALASRLADDYPDLEIVFVDDRSSDGTGDIAREMAEDDPRVKVVRVETLPDGWLGKVHALARGVEGATGEFVLFSDADVHVRRGALRSAISLCEAEAIDMIALVPEFPSPSLLVRAMWVVFLRALMLMVDPAAVRDERKSAAMGSGGFNLVRRSALDRTPGFEWLRLETADDMGLGAMVKRAGGRCEAIGGRGLVSVVIYRDFRELLRGLEKNGGTTASTPWRFTLGILLFLGVDLSPIAALIAGPEWLRILGVGALAVATATNVLALRVNDGTWLPALAWPLGSLAFAYGTLRATWLVRARGGVLWRDTFYPLEQIAAARRFEF